MLDKGVGAVEQYTQINDPHMNHANKTEFRASMEQKPFLRSRSGAGIMHTPPLPIMFLISIFICIIILDLAALLAYC